MKPVCLVAAVTGVLAAAGAASAADVKIEHAVARVVVIPEARSDVGVEIVRGSAELPALQVRRRGDRVEIDGGLRRRIGACSGDASGASQPGEGARVRVRGIGEVEVSQAPLIVVRTPMDVDVEANGAVYGAVGRDATSVELGNGGCGSWTVGNTAGRLDLSVAGSGDVRAGTSGDLDVSVAGSGDVVAGATRSFEAAVAGSGNVVVARVDGNVDISIAGSGDVTVRAGRAPSLDVAIAGSGDVHFGGEVGNVNASLIGSGDVRIASVTGSIDRSVIGSGQVIVGR